MEITREELEVWKKLASGESQAFNEEDMRIPVLRMVTELQSLQSWKDVYTQASAWLDNRDIDDGA